MQKMHIFSRTIFPFGDRIAKVQYVLSKMNFVKYAENHPDHFNFCIFVEIFTIIKTIITEENSNT